MQVKRFWKSQQNYEEEKKPRWRTLVPEFQDLLYNNTNRPTCQFPTGKLRSPCLLLCHQITSHTVTGSSREQPGQTPYRKCKLTRHTFMFGDILHSRGPSQTLRKFLLSEENKWPAGSFCSFLLTSVFSKIYDSGIVFHEKGRGEESRDCKYTKMAGLRLKSFVN